ncbi:MAG: hydantoinase B/oxoprolinase family protein [Xanthobacteraceae bacterium]
MTDVITMQVIRYALEQIADEMGNTLVRTGRSTIITEIKDISCVVCDAKGQTIAQAHHTPSLLAGFEITMREFVKTYRPEDLAPGDVIVTNDPYRGCQHIMDLYAIAPAFHRGELIGFVGNITHHTDLGGVAAGGVAGGIREIYLEGLRLPMVKLVKHGVEDQEIIGIIANQIRVPDKTLGDIRAQVSSLMVGVDRLDRLFRKYGKGVVQQACVDLLDYSERRMRQGLRAIRPGDYFGEDFIDDDGINDTPIRVAVRLSIGDGKAVVDLTASDPQAEGNTNSTIANTYAAAYYVMIAVVDPHMPANSGCYRPIEVITKSGTVVDPKPPGAVAARTNCSQKIVEALLRALAQVVPDRVCAGGHAQITTCAIGGFDENGERFVFTDIQGGGNGGRAYADGADGQDSHLPRFMNTPVESAEQRFPIRIERYELVPDSGGAGKFRGSLALRRDIRVLTGPVSFARYADRHTSAPQGLFGGRPGSTGRFTLNPDGNDPRPLRSKGLDTLQANDLIRLCLPGAGGYGDPLSRDLDALERDLADGKVTPEAAEQGYCVVVERPSLRIDREATARRRAGSQPASDE